MGLFLQLMLKTISTDIFLLQKKNSLRLKVTAFWDVALCSLLEELHRFCF
jgi:hypothetical protein